MSKDTENELSVEESNSKGLPTELGLPEIEFYDDYEDFDDHSYELDNFIDKVTSPVELGIVNQYLFIKRLVTKSIIY